MAAQPRGRIDTAVTVVSRSIRLSVTIRLRIVKRFVLTRGSPCTHRATLADIYDRFTAGFDTADLSDAKAILDEPSA